MYSGQGDQHVQPLWKEPGGAWPVWLHINGAIFFLKWPRLSLEPAAPKGDAGEAA